MDREGQSLDGLVESVFVVAIVEHHQQAVVVDTRTATPGAARGVDLR